MFVYVSYVCHVVTIVPNVFLCLAQESELAVKIEIKFVCTLLKEIYIQKTIWT